MVALKEPHLAELGWHDESQPEQGSGGHNDNAPVQRAGAGQPCRPAPCCSKTTLSPHGVRTLLSSFISVDYSLGRRGVSERAAS